MIYRFIASVLGLSVAALIIVSSQKPKPIRSICIKETANKVICYCGEEYVEDLVLCSREERG
tara:strand:- start:298 stop:483 length:186 start_codon:yes stop_codon:yes gene_type:complete